MKNSLRVAAGNKGQRDYAATIGMGKASLALGRNEFGSTGNMTEKIGDLTINSPAKTGYYIGFGDSKKDHLAFNYKFDDRFKFSYMFNKKKYSINYNDIDEMLLKHFMYDDREHFAQIAYNDENGWDAKIYYNQRRIENPDYYVVNPTNVEWEKSDHKQYGLDTKKVWRSDKATGLIGISAKRETYKNDNQKFKTFGDSSSILKDPAHFGTYALNNYSVYGSYDRKLSRATNIIFSAREDLITESWQLDFQPKLKWDYCHGLELQAMLDVYDTYGDKKIFDYALAYADTMIHNDGSIETYKLHEYNIDRLNSGKFLFRIYEQTKDEKYKKAIDLLRSQLDTHPRNEDGGFWHKKVYPNQMWLDGIYMGAPFYAEYAFRNNRVQDYQDIVNQFITVARHTYDPKNGLYRHACDVSRKERWADPVTGQSQHSWGRAMGWYAMAFVDALDFIPKHEAGRDSMLVILNNIAAQVKRIQDPKTGLWYQVLDKSGEKGNYLESSCSTMFVYALFKAVRKGYIDKSYLKVALKGYQGILDNFIEVDKDGVVTITKACAVAGLGGKNYRMGDYTYYINETIRSNDPKAVGPFIMASLEWERLQQVKEIVNQK